VEQLDAESADHFELKSTPQMHGWPFVYSDDSTVVLNVKEEAGIGQTSGASSLS
jgi:hypothetical protein